MSMVQLYSAGQYGSVSPRARRELSRIEAGGLIATARIDQRADIQSAQVDAMSAVTQRGLQGVAFISQVEQQLAQAVPLAASRLQGIADIGALGLSQIVMDTANKLRRI